MTMKRDYVALLFGVAVFASSVVLYSTVKTNRRIDNLSDRVHDLERTAEIMVENCDPELVETMDALAQEQRELSNLVTNNVLISAEEGSDVTTLRDVVQGLRGEIGALSIRVIGLEMAQ